MTHTVKDFSAQATLLARMICGVLPEVERQLDRWRSLLKSCGDAELSTQAAASIRLKRFHAQGGSIFSVVRNRVRRDLVALIVALQTISDYLDNLCDRAGFTDEKAFRQLHGAMVLAVDSTAPKEDFYRFYPYRDDGGYLDALVQECRRVSSSLPSYPLVRDVASRLAALYSDLQVYKHVEARRREGLLRRWFQAYEARFPGLAWWEFAAAAGSTLGIFALFNLAADPGLARQDVQAVTRAYFPWVCGLHILLDYLIDQAEDRVGGDLNFVSCYPDAETCRRRLLFFLQMALRSVSSLPRAVFHRTVVKGLLALYLSDPKVEHLRLGGLARELLAAGGPDARFMYHACRLLRTARLV